MTDCTVVAAPGGNPAPLVALLWALRCQRDLRCGVLHVVMYQRAEHWLRAEMIGGDLPLEQLRAETGDPALGTLDAHLARLPDGTPVEDDADPAAALAFTETLWSVFRAAQATSEAPVVVALVGGSRRTLSVDSVVAFQLLARPQDLLVDLRFDPKTANDPRSGFYFPEQRVPLRVHVDEATSIAAADVGVSIVELTVPRLRHLLPAEALGSFAGALEAGEEALREGPSPVVAFDLAARTVRLGAARVKLSPDQAVWFAVLAVARKTRPDGWIDVTDVAFIRRVSEACRRNWNLESRELSYAWEFAGGQSDHRLMWLGPIRSRLRVTLNAVLRGHPHREAVIPEKRKRPSEACERLRCRPSCLVLPAELENICG